MRKRTVTVRGKYLKQEEQTLYGPDTAVISGPLGLTFWQTSVFNFYKVLSSAFSRVFKPLSLGA